jgi:hypothetical protein
MDKLLLLLFFAILSTFVLIAAQGRNCSSSSLLEIEKQKKRVSEDKIEKLHNVILYTDQLYY